MSFQWYIPHKDGGKYGYNFNEKICMTIVTALTNFVCIPAIIVVYKRSLYF